MKVKLSTPIVNFDGTQIVEGTPAKNITLKDVLLTALRAGGQDEKDEEKKWGRFELLFKMKDAKDELELSPEQIIDLKELANKTFADVWIFGQIRKILTT